MRQSSKTGLILIFSLLVITFQNCDTASQKSYKKTKNQFLLNSSSPSSNPFAGSTDNIACSSSTFDTDGFSRCYVKPQSKLGIHDYMWAPPFNILPQFGRYSGGFKKLKPGIKMYDLSWSQMEEDRWPPGGPCGQGYSLYPSSSQLTGPNAYHGQHCYNTKLLYYLNETRANDNYFGIQTAAVLANAPSTFAYNPQCKNSVAGCLPRLEAIDAYEDYIHFLAGYRNGAPGYTIWVNSEIVSLYINKISHFIIFNEAPSGQWFDPSGWPLKDADDKNPNSPKMTNLGPQNSIQVARWAEIYYKLLSSASEGLKKSGRNDVMLYVSINNSWEQDPMQVGSGVPSQIGGKNLLDKIWEFHNANPYKFDWSLAVHPYYFSSTLPEGREVWPDTSVNPIPYPAGYNFNTLPYIAGYQFRKIQESVSDSLTDVYRHPQSVLFASEQGWSQDKNKNQEQLEQAEYICRAHESAMNLPALIGYTHNHFQSNECEAIGSSVQGAHYGFIKKCGTGATDFTLSYIENISNTYKAFLATSIDHWMKNDSHYCCTKHGIGCRTTSQIIGMYRAYNTTVHAHFFTTNKPEFDNAIANGYRNESTNGPVFCVLKNWIDGTKPLYRLYNTNNGVHYYMTSSGEREKLLGLPWDSWVPHVGWRYERDEGYIYPTPGPDRTEIFRLYNQNSGTHLYTIKPSEKDAILTQFPGIWAQHTSLGYAPFCP